MNRPENRIDSGRRRVLGATFATTLGAAALAITTAAGGAAPALAQGPSTLEKVKQSGVLRAGVKKDTPAFGYVDEKGEVVGFEVDLVKEIAKRLGVKLEIMAVTAAARIPMLQQGRVDLVAANLSHYRDRDAVIDFSIGYFYSPQTIMVRKESGITGLAGMAGKRLGMPTGSAGIISAKKVQPNLTVQTFEGNPETFLALQQGLIDAMGSDIVILAGLRAKAPKPDDFVILGRSGTYGDGEFGIGLRENDSKWRDQINFTLQDIWLDGTWDALYDRWLGKDSDIKLSKEELGFRMTVWRK